MIITFSSGWLINWSTDNVITRKEKIYKKTKCGEKCEPLHLCVLNVTGRDTAPRACRDATALKRVLEHKSITIVWQMKSITNLDF